MKMKCNENNGEINSNQVLSLNSLAVLLNENDNVAKLSEENMLDRKKPTDYKKR